VVNAALGKAAAGARAAYERALTHGLQTQVSVRVERENVHFSADSGNAEQSAALIADVKSQSFLARLANWLHREGMKAKAEDFEVKDVASHPLEIVKLHLDWRFPAGDYGPGKMDYLDGSCLLFEEDECRGIVDYRGGDQGPVKVPDAAVHHSGDVMRRDGGRHEITVRLPQLNDETTDVFFALSAYNCGDLSLFREPSISFFDAFDDSSLAKYTVSSYGNAEAVVLAKLQRHRGTWRVVAHGVVSKGTVRDYTPILKDVAPLQVAYDLHRRRFWLIRLGALLAAGRVLVRASCASCQEAQLMERIFDDVPEVLFRRIVQFL
jgi:stress response protein SCP2